MRVLLLKPNGSFCEECCCGRTDRAHLPVQILLVAVYLKRQGWDAVVNDLQVQPPMDQSLFDCVIIWVSALDTFFEDMRHVTGAKALGKRTMVVLNDPFGLEREVMDSYPDVDVMVKLYEREIVIDKVLSAWKRGASDLSPIPGVLFRSDSAIVDTGVQPAALPDLAHLGEATSVYASLPIDNYKSFCVLTGRGCPFRCAFCQYSQTPARKRETADILAEIDFLSSRGVQSIVLLDLHPAANREWAENLLLTLAQRAYRCTFALNCRLEDVLRVDYVRLMRRAGVRSASVGVESLSPGCLSDVNKRLPVERIDEGVRNLRKAHITPQVNFLLGLPNQKAEDLRDLERFVKRPPFKIAHCSFVVPIRHTPLHETFRREGLLVGDALEHYVNGLSVPMVRTHSLSTQDLLEFKNSMAKHANSLPNVLRYALSRGRELNWKFGLRKLMTGQLPFARRL